MSGIVTFQETWERVRKVVKDHLSALTKETISELWVLRDLTGRISLLCPPEGPEPVYLGLAEALHRELGAHAYPPDRAILTLERDYLKENLESESVRYVEGDVTVYLVDREVTGRRWATVSDLPGPARFVLFALKGGLGRSTTAAVLAEHLAGKGYRVMVMDFDLESPSLSSMLAPEEHPDFGIVEWLVEDLVRQGDALLPHMVGRPAWSVDLTGEVMVVPAYGKRCREHLAQLGRAYLDRPPEKMEDLPEKWVTRIQRLVKSLEDQWKPTVVIMDSRSGLHDIAAALVAHLQAQVLLFAVDSEPTWDGYRILFTHWEMYQVVRDIRERLSLMAALVPPVGQEEYLRRFRQHAWDLFREWLYDEVSPDEPIGEWFSFDLEEGSAPHIPLPIYWERGLLAWPDLRSVERGPVREAYGEFLEQFDQRLLPEVRSEY